jgi:hypothetical protein
MALNAAKRREEEYQAELEHRASGMEGLLGKAAGRAWRAHTYANEPALLEGQGEGEEAESCADSAPAAAQAAGAEPAEEAPHAKAAPAAVVAALQLALGGAPPVAAAGQAPQPAAAVDPNKSRLQQLGAGNPANVSAVLLGELSSRSDLGQVRGVRQGGSTAL